MTSEFGIEGQGARTRAMFGRIAGTYDLLNRTLSLGVDQRWRRALLDRAGDMRGKTVVDACCGTGDVALQFAKRGARVLGVDFTPQMLERALSKGMELERRSSKGMELERRSSKGAELERRSSNEGTPKEPSSNEGTPKEPSSNDGAQREPSSNGVALARAPAWAHGDALHLPVRDAVADVCTVAFGIRNVTDRIACLREMMRVVRPGGQVLVLEFTMPPGAILGPMYRTYFLRLLPAIGRTISKDSDAYSYLPRTVLAWPAPDVFEREMESVGLVECGHRLLTRGIACLHWGVRPLGERS